MLVSIRAIPKVVKLGYRCLERIKSFLAIGLFSRYYSTDRFYKA